MNKKQIANSIRQGISEGLKEYGFQFMESKERILRKHEDGFDVVYARIIDYNPVFQIELSIAIRLDKVEEIINNFIGEEIHNPSFNSLTTTIASSYDLMAGTQENYIEIKDDIELEKAIKHLIDLLNVYGLDFFNKYRNIEEANLLKKNQILKDESGLSYILTHLMQSLTLMKLCNDLDFDELSERYKKLYVPWAGQEEAGRKALDDLIEYLRKYNPEKGHA